MQRLAIVDLHKGLYPIYNHDKSRLLVYNGEIYNYKTLRNELARKYTFKTDCDGEVIIHGYEEWGTKVFTKLQGMFAIALWDIKANKLLLIRDRIGIKPLYYVENKFGLFFASEAKSLLTNEALLVPRKLDKTNIQTLLGFMYLPKSDETTISEIKKVPPATIIEVSNTGVKNYKYWELTIQEKVWELSFEDALDQLEHLLIETTKMHLMSDVPFGLLLSGGVDSSLLADIVTKHRLTGKLATYTAAFDHKFNESELARETADFLGTNHHELFVNLASIGNNIEKYIDMFDDLTTFDGGIITTKLLCEQINKNSTKVLLLGEGADELFGGYSWFGLSKFPVDLLPKYLRSYVYYYATTRNLTQRPWKYASIVNEITANKPDIFTQISNYELTTQLPNHLLMKVDKGSMSESVEARVPYLDHKFVEFVYSLRSEYKLSGEYVNLNRSAEKYILRKIAEKYLPVETAHRKKRGFLLPMKEVLDSNREKVRNYVFSSDAIGTQVLGADFVKSLFEVSKLDIINMQREYFLWRLFILEVWAKKFGLRL